MKKIFCMAFVLIGLFWNCGTMKDGGGEIAGGNILLNGGFSIDDPGAPRSIEGVENTAHWEFNLNSGDSSGDAKCTNEDGMLHIGDILNPGPNDWSIQLMQYPITVDEGGIYNVKFDARAAAPREITVKVGGVGDRQWSDYTMGEGNGTIITLDTLIKSYEFTFIMKSETDPNARFEFQLGLNASDVWIDNVKLVKKGQNPVKNKKTVLPGTPVNPGELISNGHFDENAGGWEAGEDVSLKTERGDLVVSVKSVTPGGVIMQQGVEIESNEHYLLSFTARAVSDCRMGFSLGLAGGWELQLQSEPYTIGLKEKYYSYYFSTKDEESGPASLLLNFEDDGNNPETVTLYMDKISLRKTYPFMDPMATVDERVANLLSLMTLEEKAGQMVQAERSQVNRSDVMVFGTGSILSGGGSVPGSNNPVGWIEMYNKFQIEALATRLGIPLIYGIDAVHGHTNVQGATGFPQNIGLGATRNPALLEEIGRITAAEVRATGLNWTFGPCVAVAHDIRWGRIYESYGENPEIHEMLAGAFVRGLQGEPGNTGLLEQGLVAGCAKHFIGDGGVEYLTGEGTHIDRGDITALSMEELKRIHGAGFRSAIDNGVLTVMASFSRFGGRHMHAYEELLTGYLKAPASDGGLGFEGYVIGDWDAIGNLSEIPGDYYDKVMASFNAGLDMSMEQAKWKNVIDILVRGAGEGDISDERINDAVRRILTVKMKTGLFEAPYAIKDRIELLGAEEHREVAARAVRESLVLLKNDENILPLKKDAKIYVSGPLSDNVGLQNGGWTISWQGGGDSGGRRYIEGSSILEGIQAQVAAGGGEVISRFEEARGAADVAVVVVGEKPYAEMQGDIPPDSDMTLEDVSRGKVVRGSAEAIEKALELNIPVVVILVAGRPLVVTDEIDRWDAFVAAWLPGTEGAAVADVLFGDYDFTGKLPVSWPESVEQLPLSIMDEAYGEGDMVPLYEYGFGLNY